MPSVSSFPGWCTAHSSAPSRTRAKKRQDGYLPPRSIVVVHHLNLGDDDVVIGVALAVLEEAEILLLLEVGQHLEFRVGELRLILRHEHTVERLHAAGA